jgi:hypothetical protein
MPCSPGRSLSVQPSGGLTTTTFESYLALKDLAVAVGLVDKRHGCLIAAKQFDRTSAAVRS